MSFRDINATETDPGAPVTSALMKALDGNLDAVTGMDRSTPNTPKVQSSWMGYTGGDGEGGFYNNSITGDASSTTSPDFEDGYEYRFIFDRLEFSAVDPDFLVEFYKETDAAYTAPIVLVISASSYISGVLTVRMPRLALFDHAIHFYGGYGASSSLISNGQLVFDNTAQALTRARFSYSGGVISGGRILMQRCGEYVTR